MMWVLIPLLSIVLPVVSIAAQTSEVCTISSILIPSNAKEGDAEKIKPIELGKVDISGLTEGSRIPRTYRIRGTKLYTYVEIFFDDDMKFYDSLYPALTIDILFHTGRKRTKRNVVSLTATQTAFDEDFKQTDVIGYARAPGKRVGVIVSCRGKKPKDE